MSENGNGKKELVEIFVDGQPVKVLPGINAIEAARLQVRRSLIIAIILS